MFMTNLWNSADNMHLMLGAECWAYMSSWIPTKTHVVANDVSGWYSGEQISCMPGIQGMSMFIINLWNSADNMHSMLDADCQTYMSTWISTKTHVVANDVSGQYSGEFKYQDGYYSGYVYVRPYFMEQCRQYALVTGCTILGLYVLLNVHQHSCCGK